MTAPIDYPTAFADAYWGEVYGIVLYTTIAGARTDPRERDLWSTMADLEVATERRLRPVFERLGGDPAEHAAHHRARGVADGARYGAMPWRDVMQRFSDVLAKDIAEYSEIERVCPTGDADVCRDLTEHEVVAKAFADAELRGLAGGPGDGSIDPVRNLIAQLQATSD